MKLPNGFGSVYKLSGNRRNPWCARKTVGWTFDEQKQKSYPIYKFIGYYPTRKDALTALSDYNKDPYDLDAKKLTFADVYELWSDEYFPKTSESNRKGYRACFKALPTLHDKNIVELKLGHLQGAVDASGKNKPMARKIKNLYSKMWDYCIAHEIMSPDRKTLIRYVDVSCAEDPRHTKRSIFNPDELDLLWKVNARVPLFLIYTGLRISEFYNLRKADVNIEERFFQVTESKTVSGIREVPIADKILPIVQDQMQTDGEFLFSNTQGNRFTDRVFRSHHWEPMMQDLGLDHLPHDTRHTCVSMLTIAGVDERIIKKIVGHKGQGVTQTVYTHLDIKVKLEAINKI